MGRDVKFSQDELKVKEMMPQMFGPPVEVFTTPITPRENTLLLYQGKTPMWAPFAFGEHTMIMVDCDPENQARSSKEGGIDGYGVEWVFVEVVGGAIVSRATPSQDNEWEKYVTIPTLTPGTGKAV